MTSFHGKMTVTVSRKIIISCAVIFLLSHIAFLIGIQSPTKLYFDEVHYIPAAHQFLQGGALRNVEHPPLAKELMAVGISLFGDGPLGWRYMSAFFGSLALVAVYLWALALFMDENVARWATAVTFLNQLLYVQARIAMLDVFVAAFIILALAAFTATWLPQLRDRSKLLLIATGVFLGLAIACKWVGVISWLLIAGIVVSIKVLQGWKTHFDNPTETDWYRSDLWQGVGLWHWILCLFVVPLGIYYLTFVPLGFGQLLPGNFIDAQATMWKDNSTLAGTHPYMSSWIDWPVIGRPIWYFFEGSSWDTYAARARAVVLLGNPAVLWAGIPALIVCLHGWLVHRRRDAFMIFVAYSALYLAWAVIPRRLEFLFYYLPAAMTLGPALAYMFYRTPLHRDPSTRWFYLAVCIVLFVYFLPISNAAINISELSFNRTMWFQSWR